MTTVKGFVRSYGATMRKIEREQQSRNREAAKRFKEQQKRQELISARQAVNEWNEYIEILHSIHKDCSETIYWKDVQEIEKPIEPELLNVNEQSSVKRLSQFKPTVLDKIFGSTQKKINKLKKGVESAKIKDKKEYDLKLKQYNDELTNWYELQNLAKSAIELDPEGYKDILEYFAPFSDIGELGTQLKFSFEKNIIDVDLHVISEEVIPDYELKLTSTGKLSKKNMPKSRFNELYQDHICSSVIRVAREIFAHIPVKYVRVNAISKILNGATGHMENKPILSVIFPPETINQLNLDTIDPSDSMSNFVHNMKFSKTNGFNEVEKVKLDII